MNKIILAFSILVTSNAYLSATPKENINLNTTSISESASQADPNSVKAKGKFQLVTLNYGYSDLEKSIDAETMEIHYSKHYLGYTNNLNNAIIGTEMENQSIETILKNLDMNNSAVRNNGGGYYNHSLYFSTMSPKGGGSPKGEIANEIKKDFGSFDELKKQLSDAGAKQFGSGWAWLILTEDGKLAVTSTANQDNPLMPNQTVKGTPILGIDVWEHAYYLRYQNKRADYLNAYFNVVDWDAVNNNYRNAIKK
ncbi:MAG: superoxide dismutase [Chitinophagaceae bacterium]|nr:MAG: superoxide dismutase [Bacteroidetes bacterium OLB11]MCC6447089.1 superoxide dismutase [Chitinophagaceae bacterium]HMN32479.1 superoxide dismutase [Chitinophagaceae bacterium]